MVMKVMNMDYTIGELAKLSSVSTRTLRYYDAIGLLKPSHKNASGYRSYGVKEVDLLQEILFYRELGLSLENIQLLMKTQCKTRLNPYECNYNH
jgi:DNA-binding transcriptional MerR regulator